MSLVYDAEQFTPINPVAHITNNNDAGKIVIKNDSEIQVWGLTDSRVNLDVTSYDLYGFERVRTTLQLTPAEARKIAVELMTAAALVEDKAN